MTCRVVHCKRQDYDIYIGRLSKWGNPFREGRDGTRAEVIARYEKWIKTQPRLMSQLHELRDKVLGCWCAPLPCHGDVLVRLVRGLTTPFMSHNVARGPAVRQKERGYNMAKKGRKSVTKKKAPAKKKVTRKKMVVRQTAKKAPRKTSRKTAVAAQATSRKVKKDKAPREKGGPKYALKPAIPIEQVRHSIARIQIPALVQEVREYDEQTAEIMEELGPSLEAIAELRAETLAKLVQLSQDAKIEAVEGDDWRMSYVAGERKTLDQTLLLAQGVTMAQIKKATKTTPNKPFVRISKKGDTAVEEE